jgi:hypothetical protein
MVRRSGSPLQRLRARSSGACFAVYALLAASFWAAGVLAYWRGASGAARLLGLLYLPSLALPVVGRGQLVGIAVGSTVWWWWFGAQAVIAALAICLYPYDRASRPTFAPSIRRSRLPVSVS